MFEFIRSSITFCKEVLIKSTVITVVQIIVNRQLCSNQDTHTFNIFKRSKSPHGEMLIYCDVPLNLNIQNKYRTYYKRHSEQIISVATTLHSQRSVLNCMPSAKMRPGLLPSFHTSTTRVGSKDN